MVVKKSSFLKATYGGYFHNYIPKEDEELTHYGAGTPCGEYLRRFWQPVAFTDDLKDLPSSIKIMGEELVIFRNKAGQVGCLELHCSHRGTSLEFGLIEDHGIRCCYHGWLFGVDGRILDTPGEPPDSTYKERLCHGAYPVHEAMGMVFIYMGPPDKRTPFPNLDTFNVPGYRLVPYTRDILPCNWMQMQDNAMDPVHTTYLHTLSSGTQFTDSFGVVPTMDWIETPIGMCYIATRRVEGNVWTRMGEFICPNIGQFPHNEEFGTDEHPFIPPHNSKWRVPIDDTSTLEMSLRRIPVDEKTPIPGEIGHQAARDYETRQRKPNDYEAQVSQRPIAIHALEHLGSTDRGVTMFRSIVRNGIRTVQNGKDPKGVFRNEGDVVLTYGNDTVKAIPPAATLEQDTILLRETGWKLAKQYIAEHPSLTGDVAYKV